MNLANSGGESNDDGDFGRCSPVNSTLTTAFSIFRKKQDRRRAAGVWARQARDSSI